MKKVNNCWIDECNNSWNCENFTEEQVEKISKTLENCSYCSDCSGCSNCTDCSDCSGCSRCFDCNDCSRCSGCADYKENPQRYVSKKMGSRNAQTSIYWTNKENVQIICGCFKGNIENFEKAVTLKHLNTPHLKSYQNLIKLIKQLTESE